MAKLDRQHAGMIELRKVAALERIAAALEALNYKPKTDVLTRRDTMQLFAEANKNHAAERFGDALRFEFSEDRTSGQWVEAATGKPVVFTPHGWRVEDDVKEFMSND